jgi:hypothetical protein
MTHIKEIFAFGKENSCENAGLVFALCGRLTNENEKMEMKMVGKP